MSFALLPLPRKIRRTNGRFDVTREMPVVLSPSCDAADHFAAGMLREEIEARSSVEVTVEKHGRADGLGRYILLLRTRDAAKGARSRTPRRSGPPARGFGAVKGAGGAEKIGTEGYLVEVAPEAAVVAANTSAGIYYGVQTLCQLLEARPGKAAFPGVSITDFPDFRYRGVLLDISRGRVPRLDTLFGLIEYLASMKVNVLQFHTEHTFAFRRHPDISRGKGALSAEDVTKLRQHARAHHLELQANLQSFGHMSNILSLPRYRELAEDPSNPWSISPGRPETARFLDDLYSEYLPCFDSRVFNANCDEVWDLGHGRTRKKVERAGAGRVYADHIRKLRALAAKYGKRLAIWADYVLKYPKALGLIPKDVILINWGYGARHDFGSTRKVAQGGREHWVAPGTNSWSALFPRIEVACRNIAGFARAGQKTGATGLLNTDWGDGGHPNMLGPSFHGFAYGAEAAWSGPAPVSGEDAADFDRRFAWVLARDRTGVVGKIFRTLGETNAAFGVENYRSVPFRLYWAEFPDGVDAKDVKGRELARAERIALKARSHVSTARTTLTVSRQTLSARLPVRLLLSELDFAARQTLFACQKARLAVQIQKAMLPPKGGQVAATQVAPVGFGGRALPRDLMNEVAALLREWRLHRDEFERLWHARSRHSEIDRRMRLYKLREQEFARLAERADARLGETE